MSFGNPLLLVSLLVVPAVLGAVLLARRRSSRFAVSFPNLSVLAHVATRQRAWRGAVPLVAVLVALGAIGVAVARPHLSRSAPTERATVVLALDVSRSMLSDDVQPSRLEAAKAAAQRFMEHVPGSLRVGLVTFSGDVTVPVVPTTEHRLMRDSIAAVDPYATFGGGTAIGDAIARAVEVGSETLSRDEEGGVAPGELGRLVSILFLSDGRQNRGILPPLDGAALAKQAGIAVHTVALGTDGGSTQSGFGGGFGGRNRAPDPETLQAIARLTGGEFTWARTAGELSDAYADLGGRLGRTRQDTEVTAAFVAAGAVALLLAALSGALWSPRLP
jgi:Ca-activated chloride channel family protein